MGSFDDEDATPWRTPGSTGAPLSGPAPKKYSDAEITAAVQSKPAAPPSASVASGEPQRADFPDAISYNLAYKRWAAKQSTPSVMNKGVSARSVSGK
jgi:hypothetical protein